MLITRMLYSDYIGPARLRLNLPEVAPELKRVWHPCPSCFLSRQSFRTKLICLSDFTIPKMNKATKMNCDSLKASY